MQEDILATASAVMISAPTTFVRSATALCAMARRPLHRQRDARRVSDGLRQTVDELVERDRIVADADAGGVVDRVRDRRPTPQMPSSATPLAFMGEDIGSTSSRKIDLLVRDVGMDRHLVARKIVVDEETSPLVDRQFLHQRRADAHRHRADHLAARRFRIEDAPGRAHREHTPNPNLAGRCVDPDLDEMGREGRLLVRLGEIAVLDEVLRDKLACARGLGKRHAPVTRSHSPSANTASAELKPSFCATASRSLTQAA